MDYVIDDNYFPGDRPKELHNNEPSPERLAEAERWEKEMADVEKSGDQQKEGEIQKSGEQQKEIPDQRNELVANAAVLLNYGLDGVARELGVGATLEGIKRFEPEKSDNPIRDLSISLGIDTKVEVDDIRAENRAFRKDVNGYYGESVNAPVMTQRTKEGAIKAIKDMKALITLVDTSPDFADLRSKALQMNMSTYDYIAKASMKNDSKCGLVQFLETVSRHSGNKPKVEKVEAEKVVKEKTEEEKMKEELKKEMEKESGEGNIEEESVEEVLEEMSPEEKEELMKKAQSEEEQLEQEKEQEKSDEQPVA